MKTLHELLKDHAGLSNKVNEKQAEIAGLREELTKVADEIYNKFAPKDLIGLECLIEVKGWAAQDKRSSYDLLINENIFLVNNHASGYRKEMKGRKCKIIALSLASVNQDGSISWNILANSAKANGEYGALTIRTIIVDKSHLSD